jgi:cleavage stimulation factor subunit 1
MTVEIEPSKISMYRTVIAQMRQDGFAEEARQLASKLNLPVESEPQQVLYGMFQQETTFKELSTENSRPNWTKLRCRPHPPIAPQEDLLDLRVVDDNEDFFDEREASQMDVVDYLSEIQARPPPQVKLRFNSQHKQGCRSVGFSHDGRLCASGSVDTSIKVMETSKMRMHSVVSAEGGLRPLGATADDMRPVIRTFYDHVATVSAVTFHPRIPVLYSGSIDKTVKVYDLTRPTQNKKAQSSVTDVSPINVISCHPCGDFLFVGTQHRILRLYDTTTMQCFSSYHASSQHAAAINDIKSSADGSVFSSVSADGAIFLWDGVNHRVVNKIPHAHAGHPVFTCQWSRNQRYLLTSGGDHRARLWDLRNGKMLQVYQSASTATHCDFMSATFAGHEKYILMGSSEINDGGDLTLIDSKTGSILVKKVNQHEKPVRCIASNPTDKTFLTASDDGRVRFFDIDTTGVIEQVVEQSGDSGMPSMHANSGFLQHIGL